MILQSELSKSRWWFVSWFSVLGGPTIHTCTRGFADTCDPADSSNSSNTYCAKSRQVFAGRAREGCLYFHCARMGWLAAKDGLSAMLPSFVLAPFLDQDVVCDGVPGVMNADEEQQQHRRPNAKQCRARMGASRVRRYSQRCIRGEGQQKVKQPVLELRRVYDLNSHTPSHDDLVHDPAEAQYAPKNCGGGNSVPWSA